MGGREMVAFAAGSDARAAGDADLIERITLGVLSGVAESERGLDGRSHAGSSLPRLWEVW